MEKMQPHLMDNLYGHALYLYAGAEAACELQGLLSSSGGSHPQIDEHSSKEAGRGAHEHMSEKRAQGSEALVNGEVGSFDQQGKFLALQDL